MTDSAPCESAPQRRLRLLVIEDSEERVAWLRGAVPADVVLVVAASAGRALGLLERDRGHVYAGILLDHDLQQQAATALDKQISGTEVARALARSVSPEVPVLIHSVNPRAATRMAESLRAAGFDVTTVPFDRLSRERLLGWIGGVREAWAWE